MAEKLIPLQADPRWIQLVERYAHDIVAFGMEVCSAPDALPLSLQQQAIMTLVAPPRSRVSVASGHGCFAAGTMMMRSTGEAVAVESIKVGDRLMGPDGVSVRNVLELRRGQERMYRVTYMDGTLHVVNESHVLCLVATNSKGRRVAGQKTTVTVREWLTWGEDKRRCHAAYRSGVESFEGRDEPLPVPPYILGLWLGDGDTGAAAITTSDREVDIAFSDWAEGLGCSMRREQNSALSWRVRAAKPEGQRNNLAMDALRFAGLGQAKFIPDAYLYAGRAQRLELLAGILDTDGHLNAKGSSYDFSQKCERVARDVAWLARSVGCHSTIVQTRKECCNNGVWGTYWRVTIGRNLDQIPTRLLRNKARLGTARQRNALNFGIRSIDPLVEDDYFGFVLDGDGQFLGADFTVLHNTGKTFSLAIIACWHLVCFPESHTLMTANDIDQLKSTFWKEFGKLQGAIEQGPFAWLAAHIEILADATARIRGYEATWFIESKTANNKNANKLAGRHGKHFMVIADEASSLPDPVLITLSGAMTEEGNRFLLTSQYTRTAGFFARTQTELSREFGGQWDALQLSSADSPFVSDASFKELWDSYDEDERAVRLLGLPPQNSSGLMMGQRDALAMYQRGRIIKPGESFGWLQTTDVASGEGLRDKSASVSIKVTGWGDRGPNARRVEVHHIPIFTNDIRSNKLGRHVIEAADDFEGVTHVVDSGGLGINVCQDIEDAGKTVHRVNWGNPCFRNENKNRYVNLRAQAMHHAARAAKEGRLSILTQHYRRDMIAQSSRIPKAFGSRGRLQVPEKHSDAWEGMPSPDLWDAICFAFLENVAYVGMSSADEDDTETKGSVVSRMKQSRAALLADLQDDDEILSPSA